VWRRFCDKLCAHLGGLGSFPNGSYFTYLPADSSSQVKASCEGGVMAVSVRLRFEVFKRDEFTCQYCGSVSPDCVLEVDHVVPVARGGTDDLVNLITSCWECNRGKSDVPLSALRLGEDPHDRAIALLEKERQLREYNLVLAESRERREREAWELLKFWTGNPDLDRFDQREISWLVGALEMLPAEQIREYMIISKRKGIERNLKYVKGCVRTVREGRDRNQPPRAAESGGENAIHPPLR
jgi:hypothetical protein